jgi:uncharacterized membrane protein
MLLALAGVAWLLFFIHHISHAISVNQIVDKIASETEAVVDDTMPWPRNLTRMDVDERIDSLKWESSVSSVVSGYIRYIDVKRLTALALAKAYHIKIRVLRRVRL